jgi:hypothetical protein
MAMHCSQSVVSKRQIAEEGIAGEDAPSVRGYEERQFEGTLLTLLIPCSRHPAPPAASRRRQRDRRLRRVWRGSGQPH